MNKTLCLTTTALLLSIGAVGYAQQERQQPPAQQQEQRQRQAESTPVTFTGCLTKGTQAEEYVLVDKSGEKLTFAGSSKLDSYVNQTVELRGQVIERGGEKAFQPQSIKSISSSCSGATEKK
jgi:hypothetical protein